MLFRSVSLVELGSKPKKRGRKHFSWLVFGSLKARREEAFSWSFGEKNERKREQKVSTGRPGRRLGDSFV